MATRIYFDNNVLSFDGSQLATKQQYELADRCVGSIFEALTPGEEIELTEGVFVLDDELDIQRFVVEIRQPKFKNGLEIGFHDWKTLYNHHTARFDAEETARLGKRDNPECEFRVLDPSGSVILVFEREKLDRPGRVSPYRDPLRLTTIRVPRYLAPKIKAIAEHLDWGRIEEAHKKIDELVNHKQ